MTKKRLSGAFTLVELIMVIVVIGLLAAVVVPKFTSIKTEAQNAAEIGTVTAVRSGINLAHLTTLAQGGDSYPSALDSASNAPAGIANPLFANVIDGGVTDANWEKTGTNDYRFIPTNRTFTYTPATGKFE